MTEEIVDLTAIYPHAAKNQRAKVDHQQASPRLRLSRDAVLAAAAAAAVPVAEPFSAAATAATTSTVIGRPLLLLLRCCCVHLTVVLCLCVCVSLLAADSSDVDETEAEQMRRAIELSLRGTAVSPTSAEVSDIFEHSQQSQSATAQQQHQRQPTGTRSIDPVLVLDDDDSNHHNAAPYSSKPQHLQRTRQSQRQRGSVAS